ncbi:MAG TPA: S41 family peptidase [Spirochaetia bacterium]|nr:S41 family peptidase [Spirochaetia bacterium]
MTLQDREALLTKVSSLVEKKHFNPGLKGANWPQLVAARKVQILEAETIEKLESEIQELLAELKTSHTGIFHRSLRKIPARFAINATFQRCALNGTTRWMFQDIHEGGAAHAAGIVPGDILLELDGKEIVPPEQPVFRMGQSTPATVERLNGERVLLRLEVSKPKSKERPINQPRPVSWSKLTEGIGLLKITMFPGAVGIDLAHDIDRAMADLRGTNRLIVDLRGNTGGGIGGLRLMSYLTPDKRPVGYSLTKKRAAKGYRREDLARFGRIPSRKIALLGLVLRYAFVDKSIAVVTEGLGGQPFHGRVILLLNHHSASAAEMVGAFARENHLATIIGTETPGRLLSGSMFKVGHGFVLGLPVAAYLTWEGTLLEGKGIEPDHMVELSYEGLREGRDTQMEKAIEVARQL